MEPQIRKVETRRKGTLQESYGHIQQASEYRLP
jgi:hypothetical protein